MSQLGHQTGYVDNLTRSSYWIGLIGALLAFKEDLSYRLT